MYYYNTDGERSHLPRTLAESRTRQLPAVFFLRLFWCILHHSLFFRKKSGLPDLSLLIFPEALYYNTGLSKAGVAQQAEQIICNQQVAGSSPITSSGERFPSGQRGQTVNLLSQTSEVRILPSPPLISAVGTGSRNVLRSSLLLEDKSGLQGSRARAVGWYDDGGSESVTLFRFYMAGIAQLARASAFQAEGRGFESRFPLQMPA